MTLPEKTLTIDVRAVVRDKSRSLYRKIPGFAFTGLEKLIRQDDINDILTRFGHLRDVPFISAVLDDLRIRRESEGLETLPAGERYLFVSNHPLGGLDGFALAEAVQGRFGDVRLVVNDLLMHLVPIRGLFTPINKHGRQNSGYVRGLNEILAGDLPVVYFPAGLCSRRIRGRVTDLPWKKTAVQKALESGRTVVPVYVCDKNSSFFYTFANLRKKLGIGVNLEMLLLPSELFKKRGKGRIRLFFGAPVPPQELRNGWSAARWTEELRRRCYALAPHNLNG